MVVSATSLIKIGATQARDPVLAVAELSKQIVQPDPALILFFCANSYDLERLAEAMRDRFGDADVLGCTTSGELGPGGYGGDSLVGVSLPKDRFHIATKRLDSISEFEATQGRDAGITSRQILESQGFELTGKNTFGLQLIDGLCAREEFVASAIHEGLGDVEVIGASVGDGDAYESTAIYHQGAFHTDCAVLALVRTSHDFQFVQSQPLVADGERMVVTKADPERRLVHQIDGRPAALAYAQSWDLDWEDLCSEVFATKPLAVRLNGRAFARSIQQVHPDGSLTFQSGIDQGLVLVQAQGVELVDNLRHSLHEAEQDLGEIELLLGFESRTRYLEIEATGLKADCENLLTRHPTVGFHTYGEQLNGMHLNQTFTGVAIGNESNGQ